MKKSEITTVKQYDFIFSKENNRFVQIFYKLIHYKEITTEELEFSKMRAKKYFEIFKHKKTI